MSLTKWYEIYWYITVCNMQSNWKETNLHKISKSAKWYERRDVLYTVPWRLTLMAVGWLVDAPVCQAWFATRPILSEPMHEDPDVGTRAKILNSQWQLMTTLANGDDTYSHVIRYPFLIIFHKWSAVHHQSWHVRPTSLPEQKYRLPALWNLGFSWDSWEARWKDGFWARQLRPASKQEGTSATTDFSDIMWLDVISTTTDNFRDLLNFHGFLINPYTRNENISCSQEDGWVQMIKSARCR